MFQTRSFFLLFFFLFFELGAALFANPITYLTWTGDPTTTMTVLWQEEQSQNPKSLFYRKKGDGTWTHKTPSFERVIHSKVLVYRVDLENLEPATSYEFQVGRERVFSFRTLPDTLNSKVKVVIGGDAYFFDSLNRKMNQNVAKLDPDFVILGGDIAYTEGLRRAFRSNRWKIQRWQKFFSMWSDDLVTQEGRMIPIMPVIGNHDIKEGFDYHLKKPIFFFQMFAFETKGVSFRVMDIGGQLRFYLLDSGHAFPIAGRQTQWLEKALAEGKEALYHIPAYHIGGYPSETAYTHRASKDIRKFWCPLFEECGVKVSMEHDSHTFKRTYPIKREKIDPDGIIYLGDGAWGVRADPPYKRWYLEKALQKNHVWLLTIDSHQGLFEAYDEMGVCFDRITMDPLPVSKEKQVQLEHAQ